VIGLSSAHLLGWSESLARRADQTRQAVEPYGMIPPTPLGKRSKGVVPSNGPIPAPRAARTATQLKLPKPPAAEIKLPPRPGFGVKPPVKTPVTEAQVILTPRERAKKRVALPPIDLLDTDSHTRYGATDANRKAQLIKETLSQFGIPVDVVETNSGPTITQFGLRPGFIERRGMDGTTRPRKISVNRIAALQHDLELALAAAPIRIEAPVPGKDIVGVEVPNENISLVSLRGILESEQYKKKKSPLRIALGRDVSGASTVSDLETMPHLLIAGATGSGKSVCINAIIACLLFSNPPERLRLMMIDPKRVELTPFNGIPHLLGPVVVDMSEVVPALRWVTREMDNRFSLFAKEKVRNIDAFNEKMEKSNGPQMPYLLVLVDELADLMLIAAEDTEKLLTRLAQLARATGIHLVLATQRPSVDVVTGLIKANFPARISFAVTSSVDSRVVLDMPGAEKLLGRGDMLYMASDSSKLSRLQGCFVSDDELARLVRFWRNKVDDEGYEIPKEPPWKGLVDAREGSDEDLIAQATALAQQTPTISISFMQRKLGIGYPRAARLMDLLEERGVVGPDEGGGKPRWVLRQEEKAKGKSKK
jgi:S-DNA-T family DNA segregation ATPase FtsK/SpoIIIE